MVAYDHVTQPGSPESITTPASDGVYVYGHFLEGAAWDEDSMKLCECAPKVLYVPAPIMWLVPYRVDQIP